MLSYIITSVVSVAAVWMAPWALKQCARSRQENEPERKVEPVAAPMSREAILKLTTPVDRREVEEEEDIPKYATGIPQIDDRESYVFYKEAYPQLLPTKQTWLEIFKREKMSFIETLSSLLDKHRLATTRKRTECIRDLRNAHIVDVHFPYLSILEQLNLELPRYDTQLIEDTAYT